MGPDCLFVAYYASAELGCHLALGYSMPSRILDLFIEFRNRTNGRSLPCGRSLAGALTYFGLDSLDVADKTTMRELAMRGGPYSAAERDGLLSYCQGDVDALDRLLRAMASGIDLPRALLRGRSTAAAARMEWNGVPIDIETWARLRENWHHLRHQLVARVNERLGVYEPITTRSINPASPYGAALMATAAETGLDVCDLADAVDHLWHGEREAVTARAAAVRVARRRTGLSLRRVGQWEDGGADHASYPDLDVTGRQLAGEFPELGIGRGYDPDAPDEDDHAGRLWGVLREPTPKPRRRGDPSLIREAAEVLAASCSTPTVRPMRFSAARFIDLLKRLGIAWPMLSNGQPALDDDTFREMARLHHGDIALLREVRYALAQMRLHELAIGRDGRNRVLLSCFSSRTGRNQPSNSAFVFGSSVWERCLIQPGRDRAVAYIDYSGQEYGIAAGLSGDPVMGEDYRSGDPYLAFAKRAGAVPVDATKETHARQRELFKVCCGLGAMYGAGEHSLAVLLGIQPVEARELLRLHRQTYPIFWQWSDRVEARALLTNRMRTVFGWTLHIGPNVNARSIRNWPMQSHGAEMLRLACCLATERGVMVCAPIHDALLIEAATGDIENAVEATRQAMREASALVLPAFPLRTDAKVVKYPDRYSDARGRRMWELVTGLLDTLRTDAVGRAEGTLRTDAETPSALMRTPSYLISFISS
jgi:hypothetical protein